MYMHAHEHGHSISTGVPGDQNRVLDSLKLESQIVLNLPDKQKEPLISSAAPRFLLSYLVLMIYRVEHHYSLELFLRAGES